MESLTADVVSNVVILWSMQKGPITEDCGCSSTRHKALAHLVLHRDVLHLIWPRFGGNP